VEYTYKLPLVNLNSTRNFNPKLASLLSVQFSTLLLGFYPVMTGRADDETHRGVLSASCHNMLYRYTKDKKLILLKCAKIRTELGIRPKRHTSGILNIVISCKRVDVGSNQ
jgi:hypothetical protein